MSNPTMTRSQLESSGTPAVDRTDPLTLVLKAVSSRWSELGASDYAWVVTWATEHLREVSADVLVDAIGSHQESGMPAAAELVLATARLTSTTSSSTFKLGVDARAAPAVPDHEPGEGAGSVQHVTAPEDLAARLMPTIFVPHELITAFECSDDGVLLWIALGRIRNSHSKFVVAKQDDLLAVLGWQRSPAALRRLRRAIESLEKAGGVRTQVRQLSSGGRYRVYQRLLVPSKAHGGRFEKVPREVVDHIAATIGSAGLRHWLLWGVEVGGSRHTSTCIAAVAQRWGTSVSTVKRRRRDLVAAGVLSVTQDPSSTGAGQHWVDVLPLDRVLHRGVTDVRYPLPEMSGGQVTDVHSSKDLPKTDKDVVVTSVTQETWVEDSDSDLRASASPPPAKKSHRQPAHVQRAKQILAQVQPIGDLDPKLRGQCRSRLARLLDRHPRQLTDTGQIVHALRLRFDQPDTGDARHCQMITEAVSGIVADHKAAHRPPSDTQTVVPYRRVPDQVELRGHRHQEALDAAAATHPPAPNVADADSEIFDWCCAVATRRVQESALGLEKTLRAVQRSLSANLIHPRHHDDLAAAVEWVRYHAAPLQQLQTTTKAGF